MLLSTQSFMKAKRVNVIVKVHQWRTQDKNSGWAKKSHDKIKPYRKQLLSHKIQVLYQYMIQNLKKKPYKKSKHAVKFLLTEAIASF
jgi:hypothetical protein